MSIDSLDQNMESPTPDAGFVASQFGMPAFDRRLSDKILAAHNHAYATGDVVLARQLLVQLQQAEETECEVYRRKSGGSFGSYSPRQSNAVLHGKLWQAYVDARNSYNSLNLQPDASAERLASAATAMKRCYAKWVLA